MMSSSGTKNGFPSSCPISRGNFVERAKRHDEARNCGVENIRCVTSLFVQAGAQYFYSIAEKTFLNRNSRACQTQAKLVTELQSTRELLFGLNLNHKKVCRHIRNEKLFSYFQSIRWCPRVVATVHVYKLKRRKTCRLITVAWFHSPSCV